MSAAPSLAAAAMQFVLSFEAVGSMVTGIMGSEELAANAAACAPSALTPDARAARSPALRRRLSLGCAAVIAAKAAIQWRGV